MAIDNEATSDGPTPPQAELKAQVKRRPGRPKKAPTSTPGADNSALFELMQKQINALTQKLAEKQEASLATLPEPTEERIPGTYLEIGKDSSGAPILGKVRWNKSWIEKVYAPVTFTPTRSMDIGPHGIMYHVDAEVEITVPSIVKSLYDEALRIEKARQNATKPLSAQEVSDIDARANEQPGSKQYSRLYRLAGGLNVSQQETPEPEPVK